MQNVKRLVSSDDDIKLIFKAKVYTQVANFVI